MTIVKSWKKIISVISQDDDFLGFNEVDMVSAIIDTVKTIPGGEDIVEENIRHRLDCDQDVQSYEQLTDQQIIDKVKGVEDEEEVEKEEEG